MVAETVVKPDTAELLPLDEYDKIIVMVSGGKDSLAALLDLLDRGVDRARIECWHHGIDGDTSGSAGLMDWPITPAYSEAIAKHLGIRHLTQYREGGFEAEMLRDDSATGEVLYENLEGEMVRIPAKRISKNTRLKFPQVSGDLSVRWCSAYLKIDVARRVISNDPRLKEGKYLLITGERREESSARAKYAEIERHPGTNKSRVVTQWRSIVSWTEEEVWATIKRHGINPHPAYYLGWGRVSCLACIFGNRDQWASVRQLAPKVFGRIATFEKQFKTTIRRSESILEAADKGQEYVSDKSEELKALAMSREYPVELVAAEAWEMPEGAFKACGAPT